MEYSSLIPLALISFTMISILLLIFSSGGKAISKKSGNKDQLKDLIRKRELANKAAASYLLLQEDFSDLKIINDFEEIVAENGTVVDMYSKSKRLKRQEKIVV